MIPQIVKKIQWSDLRYADGGSWVSTKLLRKLNITEDEPLQIKGGARNGSFIIVREFWQREWQTFCIITEKQAEFYFNNLFKSEKKKKEYDKLEPHLMASVIDLMKGYFDNNDPDESYNTAVIFKTYVRDCLAKYIKKLKFM